MSEVQQLRASDRHAHAVERNLMIRTNALKRPMRWTTGAHVVFCVHLKEAGPVVLLDDGWKMLVLETGSDQRSRRAGRKAETCLRRRRPDVAHCVHRARLRFPADTVRLGERRQRA